MAVAAAIDSNDMNIRVVHRVRRAALTLALATLAYPAAGAQVTPPRTAAPLKVIVRGVVFDSLTMAPVPHAAVWLPGGTQTTNADDNGRFELDDIPVGKHFLAFSSPALDSLGLGTLGNTVDVIGNGTQAQLVTPSFRTIWRSLCSYSAGSASSSDSGIVWGTVRDANTDTRLSGAFTGFSWYAMSVSAEKKVGFREETHQVRTDSTGNYYACGLPSDIKISSEATGTRSASGTIEYVIGPRRLFRVDLLVSTDMVLQKQMATTTAADSLAALRAHGTAVLRGTVRNTKGEPVVGANITLASVDTSTRTNEAGEFVLTSLPAGSHALQARQLGFAPATTLVDLRPKQTTLVTMEMPAARTLAAYNVKADRVAGKDQLEFDYRKKAGLGYTLTESEFANRPDVTSMLLGLPGVTPQRSAGMNVISISNRRGGTCVPLTYVDGIRTEPDQATMYNPKDMRAVELYNSPFTVPVGFDNNGCGVILFWTKRNSRW